MSDDQYDQDPNYDPEQQIVGAKWKLVDLPEMPAVSGEEEDELLLKFKAKLYRFRKGEWKERGVGELKFLKNKETGLVRLLSRAEKTHKVTINSLLQKKEGMGCLEPMKTSDKAWNWICNDYSEEKPQLEKICARFTSKEDFLTFQTQFEKCTLANNELLELKAKTTTTATSAEKKQDEGKQVKSSEVAEAKPQTA